jgi:NitT/TauT family transport system ATP-binding protein
MIRIRDLTFAYPGQPPIFQGFDWEVPRSGTWAVLGPSGCGKTTLLYLLAGLLNAGAGEIKIDGISLTRPRPRTGLILQDYGLLPWATVRQNTELGLRVRDFYGPDGTHAPRDHAAVPDVFPWLERLGIGGLADQFPGQISGGQRQRAAIARTLALKPDLLLMDEPFSSLDAVNREDLQGLTLQLCREEGLTFVIITHSIEEAIMMGRSILVLGPPPNTSARTFDNPGAGDANYRLRAEYAALYQQLRAEMDHEKAA